MGYAGGRKVGPTYHDLGDHTESIQIDYDPSVVSYAELLERFYAWHNPCRPSSSRQYQSLILVHDEAQRKMAQARLAQESARRAVHVEIREVGTFWPAEAYHQKYYLRQTRALMEEFSRMYADDEGFMNSTAAARVNGYVGGHGTADALRADLQRLGLTEEGQKRLVEMARLR